ncbi:hypothetical protein GQ457_05G028160 [Hibiscus cannabinus]
MGSGYRRFMRIKVKFDTRLPLKRRKKIAVSNGESTYARFEYERIKLFCFLCGKLGHDEAFCPVRLSVAKADIVFQWDISLRAPDRRPQPENRWLREESYGSASRSQGIGKSGGILFPNLPVNYGRNFRQDLKGDSSLMEKSTGVISGRSSSQMEFQMGLASEDSPMTEVKRLWAASSGPIPDRLVMLGEGLDGWFSHIKRDRQLSVRDLRKCLTELADLYPTDEVLHETIDVKLALNLEIDREELYWEQRARANWLKNGDQNSAFFHRFATQRRRQNRVSGLDDGSGQRVEDPGDMAAVAMQYFQSLFLSQAPTEWDHVLSGLSPCITPVMNESLTRPFTIDEVLSAVKAMSPLKAAGADGLGAVFYQRFWGIMGQEVGRYCIELLAGLHSFSNINHTHIVLIPKLSSLAIDVSEISPIIENTKALVSRFACCQFRFTHRIANRTAHAMAKEGRGLLQDRFWVEEAPSAVSDLAEADRCLLEPP